MERLNKALMICALTTLAALGGCVSTNASEMKAALLDNPSVETRKLVQQGLATLLNGQQVMLADKVFSASSQFILERKQHTDEQGRLLDGRQPLAPADSFSLLKNDKGCYLRHDQSERHVLLHDLTCRYASDD